MKERKRLILSAVALIFVLCMFLPLYILFGSENYEVVDDIVAATSVVTPMVGRSMVLKDDGTIWGWGPNLYGRLGDGGALWVFGNAPDGSPAIVYQGDLTNDSTRRPYRSTPGQVLNINNVTAIATGGYHTLALRGDGTLWAWGSNRSGEQGNIDSVSRSTPVQVDLSNVIAISAGVHSSVALRGDGTVWTWGFVYGPPDTSGWGWSNAPTLVQMQGLNSVVAVAAGGGHFIALKDDGTVWTWGANMRGELGDGTTINRIVPVRVQNLSNVIAIDAGSSTSLALRSDGTVWAWGWDGIGNVEDTSATTRTAPVQVQNLSNIAAISGRGSHSLALKDDGTVWAWGVNRRGELGDGTTINRVAPVRVQNISGVTAIAANWSYSIALKEDGTVWAWGRNDWAELGDGTRIDQLTPVQVLGPGGEGHLNLFASSSSPPTPTPPPPNRLTFRATTQQLYDNPRVVIPLPSTATIQFTLSRQVASIWMPVQTARADADGWVTFPEPLTGNTTYRMVAISQEFIHITGYWQFSTDSNGRIFGIPLAHGGNNGFINNPAGHAGWHVGFTQNYDVIITTADELRAIGGPQSAGRTFILANNITIVGNWTPIEDFRGTLDGAGHVITLSSHNSNPIAIAGLFGTIGRGTVVIRNLGVETGGGFVFAQAPRGGNSRAAAGGIIGIVIGGDVTIENSYFNGAIGARSDYCKAITGLLEDPARFMLYLIQQLALPRWPSLIYDALSQAFSNSGSYAYAGGMIGFIGGNANVNIRNSYARGIVYSHADRAGLDTALEIKSGWLSSSPARAYSGGFVGAVNYPAQIRIEFSYVTNDIQSYAAPSNIRRRLSHAGSLEGTHRGWGISHSNFHISTQTLTVNEGLVSAGHTNSFGAVSLSPENMRNRASFTGWDFINIWTSAPNRNDRFPFPQIFDPPVLILPQGPAPTVVVASGFAVNSGSGNTLNLEIDMPFSSFRGVRVNGVPLTQGEHFTATFGSTHITLLSGFLDTLDEGFHDISIVFDDDIVAEEKFLIIEADESDDPPIYRLYINNTLVYWVPEGLLIDENQLDLLHDNLHSFRVELKDGRIEEHNNLNQGSNGAIHGSFTIPNLQIPLTIELRQDSATGSLISTVITPAVFLQPSDPIDFIFNNIAPGTYSLIFRQPGHTGFTINNVIIPEDAEIINLTHDPRFPRHLPLRPGDVRGHGQVNIADLSILLQNWSGDYINANFTGSGQINISDLNMLLQNWMAESTVVD